MRLISAVWRARWGRGFRPVEGASGILRQPVLTMMIPDASHAPFPKQPQSVAEAVIGWIMGLEAVGLGQAAQRGVRGTAIVQR